MGLKNYETKIASDPSSSPSDGTRARLLMLPRPDGDLEARLDGSGRPIDPAGYNLSRAAAAPPYEADVDERERERASWEEGRPWPHFDGKI